MSNYVVGYIAGAGHSGSTLTDLLLGSHHEVASFGEIKNLGDLHAGRRGGGGLCTCGRKVRDCEVWGPVIDVLRAEGLSPEGVRPRHDHFNEVNRLIFDTLVNLSRRRFLVDSSKTASRLERLWTLPQWCGEVKVIHVVRDGRAVAYSHTRKGREFHEWLRRWVEHNEKVERAVQPDAEYLRINYEGLVSDVPGTVERILRFLGVGAPSALNLAWANRVRHNVGGNRMRRGESSEVHGDYEYLEAVSDACWEEAWNAIGETLHKYGYQNDKAKPWNGGRALDRRNP